MATPILKKSLTILIFALLFLLKTVRTNFISISSQVCVLNQSKKYEYRNVLYGPKIVQNQSAVLHKMTINNKDLCKLQNSSFFNLNDSIAFLASRGNCTFSNKTINAEKSGADFLIIYNLEDSIITPSANISNISYNIPSIIINKLEAESMLNQIKNCERIIVHFYVTQIDHSKKNSSQYSFKFNSLPFIYLNIQLKYGLSYFRQFFHHYLFDELLPLFQIQHLILYTNDYCGSSCNFIRDCIFYGHSSAILCYQPYENKYTGRQILTQQIRSTQIYLYSLNNKTLQWWQYNELFANNQCFDAADLENCIKKTLIELKFSYQAIQNIFKTTELIIKGFYEKPMQFKLKRMINHPFVSLNSVTQINNDIINMCANYAIDLKICNYMLSKPTKISINQFQQYRYEFEELSNTINKKPSRIIHILLTEKVVQNIDELHIIFQSHKNPSDEGSKRRKNIFATFGFHQQKIEEENIILSSRTTVFNNKRQYVIFDSKAVKFQKQITVFHDYTKFSLFVRAVQRNTIFSLNSSSIKIWSISNASHQFRLDFPELQSQVLLFYRILIKNWFWTHLISFWKDQQYKTKFLVNRKYPHDKNSSYFTQSFFQIGKDSLLANNIHNCLYLKIEDTKEANISYQFVDIKIQAHFKKYITHPLQSTYSPQLYDQFVFFEQLNQYISIFSFDLSNFISTRYQIVGAIFQISTNKFAPINHQLRSCTLAFEECPDGVQIINFDYFYNFITKSAFYTDQIFGSGTDQFKWLQINYALNSNKQHLHKAKNKFYLISTHANKQIPLNIYYRYMELVGETEKEKVLLKSQQTLYSNTSKKIQILFNRSISTFNLYLTIQNNNKNLRIFSRVYVGDNMKEVYFQKFNHQSRPQFIINQQNYYILKFINQTKQTILIYITMENIDEQIQKTSEFRYAIGFSSFNQHMIAQNISTRIALTNKKTQYFTIIPKNSIAIFNYLSDQIEQDNLYICISKEQAKFDCYGNEHKKNWKELNKNQKIFGIRRFGTVKYTFYFKNYSENQIINLIIKSFNDLVQQPETQIIIDDQADNSKDQKEQQQKVSIKNSSKDQQNNLTFMNKAENYSFPKPINKLSEQKLISNSSIKQKQNDFSLEQKGESGKEQSIYQFIIILLLVIILLLIFLLILAYGIIWKYKNSHRNQIVSQEKFDDNQNRFGSVNSEIK